MSKKCDRCHEDVPENPKLTSESEPYCSHCGYVFGTSIAPAVWACGCGETVLNHGGDEIPFCVDCEVPMTCAHATASNVHGVATGIADLDLGLELLIDAQEVDLELGSDILRDSLS
jgi:hypothetical protein